MNDRLLKKLVLETIQEILGEGEDSDDPKEFKHLERDSSNLVVHKNCGGHFREMSLHDDWEGRLTCDECGRHIKQDIIRSFKKKTQDKD